MGVVGVMSNFGFFFIYTTVEILEIIYLLIEMPSTADFTARLLCSSGV